LVVIARLALIENFTKFEIGRDGIYQWVQTLLKLGKMKMSAV
jgi:hypothetical protein